MNVQTARDQVAIVQDLVVRIRRLISEAKVRSITKIPTITLLNTPPWLDGDHLRVISRLTKSDVRMV